MIDLFQVGASPSLSPFPPPLVLSCVFAGLNMVPLILSVHRGYLISISLSLPRLQAPLVLMPGPIQQSEGFRVRVV